MYYLFLVWLGAIGFFLEQNFYFGGNAFPQSDSELMADGFTAILVSLAAVTTVIWRKK